MAFTASIFGSCVSRDLIAMALPDVACLEYVARQSVISCGHEATFDGSSFQPEHAFTKKAFESDIRGDGFARIIAHASATDVVLWDIVDERLGIFLNDKGEVLTRNIDVTETTLYDNMPGWNLVSFGSQRHLAMFAMAATLFVNELRAHDLLSKTLFVSTPWATTMHGSTVTPPASGLTPEKANVVMADYEAVIAELGVQFIRPSSETVVADPDHRWGPAAFHFVPEFYDSLALHVREFAGGRD